MKKITLLAAVLFAGLFANAQEEENQRINVLSLELSGSVGGNIGLTYEYTMKDGGKGLLFPEMKKSSIVKAYYSATTLESNNIYIKDVDGTGFGFELGSRTYFNKNAHKGFYYANYLVFGNYEFDEENIYDTSEFGGDGKFYGKYRYFSFFNPEVGFKFLIANTIAIDLHIGAAWLIELKGKGDVDNKNFDNWVPRAGLAVGYSF